MIAHVVGLIVTVAGIIFCTLLPFLPGGYDPLAVPMWAMAQTFGRVGLLLVPIGVMWFASRYSTSRGRAIRNNAGLIGDIERYRQAHGEYPISLVALWGD